MWIFFKLKELILLSRMLKVETKIELAILTSSTCWIKSNVTDQGQSKLLNIGRHIVPQYNVTKTTHNMRQERLDK